MAPYFAFVKLHTNFPKQNLNSGTIEVVTKFLLMAQCTNIWTQEMALGQVRPLFQAAGKAWSTLDLPQASKKPSVPGLPAKILHMQKHTLNSIICHL